MEDKYIEERFPLWYAVPGGVDKLSSRNCLIDDGKAFYASVSRDDAGEIINRHNAAIRMIKRLVALGESHCPEEFGKLWYGEHDGV